MHPIRLRVFALPSRSHLPLSTRLLAGALALVVLALTVLVAAPGAHQHLHDHGAAHPEEGCAVELFAQGVLVATALTLASLFARPVDWMPRLPRTVVAAVAAHRLPPGCGPPQI